MWLFLSRIAIMVLLDRVLVTQFILEIFPRIAITSSFSLLYGLICFFKKISYEALFLLIRSKFIKPNFPFTFIFSFYNTISILIAEISHGFWLCCLSIPPLLLDCIPIVNIKDKFNNLWGPYVYFSHGDYFLMPFLKLNLFL